MITDFERGLRNACERIFPGVTLQGCFFHLVRVSLFALHFSCVYGDLGGIEYLL